MYSSYNKGLCAGVLASDPHKAAEGVTLITIRVVDDRINPVTKKHDVLYPQFVVYGHEAEKAIKYLVKGQEIQVDYKIETRKKEIEGETRHFQDLVVTYIKYGKRPELPKTDAVDEPEEPKEDN